MTSTKLLMVILALGMTVATVAVAEEFVPPAPRSALEFQIGSNFNLETFEGTLISYKKINSDSRAWRLGVSPSFQDTRDYQSIPTGASYEQYTRHYSLGVTWQYLFLGEVRDRTRFYWGVGPTAAVYYDEYETTRIDSDGIVNIDRRINRSWSVGAALSLGVEFFATRSLSFMGEYGMDVGYRKHESTRDNSESESWRLLTNGARLGIAVSF